MRARRAALLSFGARKAVSTADLLLQLKPSQTQKKVSE